MNQPTSVTSASQKIAITVVLVLSVALVGVLFMRSRTPAETTPTFSAEEAAARAHEAAGGQVGGVAPGFQQRLHDAQAALAEDSLDVDRLLDLAHLYDDGHQAADAVPLYRRVIELAPEQPMPYFDLAGALVELREFDEATQVLEGWIEQHPDDVRALFNLGAVRANAGDFDAARSWFDEVIRANTDAALTLQAQQAILRLEQARAGA